MRHHFRRTLLLVMAFLTFNVGATPLTAVANINSSLTESAGTLCAMTLQVGCGCCHNVNGEKSAAQRSDKKLSANNTDRGVTAKAETIKGQCACNVSPAPATPSAPVSNVVTPVLVCALPMPVVTLIHPVYIPEAMTPPVGSHAPPRTADRTADAGRAPPSF